jgi:hypothetical protein
MSLLLQVCRDFRELGKRSLKIFDNGDRGSGRHGREARRVSEWEFVNQFLAAMMPGSGRFALSSSDSSLSQS